MNDYARNGTGELRNGTTIRSSVTAVPSLCAAVHFLSSESFLSGIDFSSPLRYGRNDNGMNDYARNGTMRETVHFYEAKERKNYVFTQKHILCVA